jgi:hypothetical protein
MIALWMLYCVGVSLLLALAALVLEHGMRLRGLPLRWAWMGALLGSMSLTVAPWFASPDAGGAGATATAVPPRAAFVQSGLLGLPIPISRPDVSVLPALGNLDQPLLLMWGLLSGSAFVFIWGAQRHLGRRRRAWRWTTLDGVSALISREVGPAVVGILDATIVLPAWVLDLEPERRRLVIAHEREHVRARDNIFLALGAVFLTLMPWNVPIWWQVRRLRGAIEFDCDARVLDGGHDVGRYTTLLVEIGVRRSVPSLAFAALSESRTLLERRIRTMLTPRTRHSKAALAVSSVLALALLVVACEAPQPSVAPIGPRSPAESVRPHAPDVDNRVAINRISTRRTGDSMRVVVLEVKPGPTFVLGGVEVPGTELGSVIARVAAPNPWKVMFGFNPKLVSKANFKAASRAADAGLSKARDAAKQYAGGGPGEYLLIKVMDSPARQDQAGSHGAPSGSS